MVILKTVGYAIGAFLAGTVGMLVVSILFLMGVMPQTDFTMGAGFAVGAIIVGALWLMNVVITPVNEAHEREKADVEARAGTSGRAPETQ